MATGSRPRGNDQADKLITPKYTPAHLRPQAAHFRCGDRAAPISAAAAPRPLAARQYIAAEPHRPSHADIEKMVASLPYGQWVCADGRVVIFNRRYSPLWERLSNGVVQRANAGEWVKWVSQSWFDLGSARYERDARERLRKVLREFLDGKRLPSKDCVP